MNRGQKKQAVVWPARSGLNEFVESFSNLIKASGFEVKDGNLSGIRGNFKSPPDLYVIHWIDTIFSNQLSLLRVVGLMTRLFLNLLFLKICGVKIVWVVHNIAPHDIKWTHALLYTLSIRCMSFFLNGWMTLSPATRAIVIEKYRFLNRIPNGYIWHPGYKNYSNHSKLDARKTLSLPERKTIFGHVGMLRSYKNLDFAASVFKEFHTDKHFLFYTGYALEENAGQLAAGDKGLEECSFRLMTEKMTRENVDTSLTSLDVFLAPYHNFLHSGAIIHALCRGCVVIAPKVPFTLDLQQKLGEDWLVLFEGSISTDHFAEAEKIAWRRAKQLPDMRFTSVEENLPLFKQFITEAGILKSAA